jgi:hypothetical protein
MTSFLCIFIKWYRCSPQRVNCAKPRRAPVADSVSRLMVQGREHSSTGSGRTMVRSRGGPISISHPTGQPSGSWKYIETGTSLYVQLTKLVDACLRRDASDSSPHDRLCRLHFLYLHHNCHKLKSLLSKSPQSPLLSQYNHTYLTNRPSSCPPNSSPATPGAAEWDPPASAPFSPT